MIETNKTINLIKYIKSHAPHPDTLRTEAQLHACEVLADTLPRVSLDLSLAIDDCHLAEQRRVVGLYNEARSDRPISVSLGASARFRRLLNPRTHQPDPA